MPLESSRGTRSGESPRAVDTPLVLLTITNRIRANRSLSLSLVTLSRTPRVVGHRSLRDTAVLRFGRVCPAFLDSVLRRAHSALPLNTPADLSNGWFPEQTTVDM